MTQKQQVTTRQSTLKKQSMYGPSSTQKYLPLNALHVATLTHNAKEANQKSSVGAPKRLTMSGSRRDSVADTELDGCYSVTDLDFDSVTDIEFDCSSVADKESDCSSVTDIEFDCSSVADKESDCSSVADIEFDCSSVADKELDCSTSSVTDKELDCGRVSNRVRLR